MVDCKICENPYCEHAGTQRGIVVSCNGYIEPKKPQTNADRIRAMSDEDLAKFLAKLDPRCSNCPADDVCTGCSSKKGCVDWLQDWLRQPAKDGNNDS